jgi:hypothetical protein
MSLEQALAVVKAAGFRVSKPRPRAKHSKLNAIGKPYSPQYDPNYRMKYKTPSIARLCKPMPDMTPWVKPTGGTMIMGDTVTAW